MQFFKLEGYTTDEAWKIQENRADWKKHNRKISLKTRKYNDTRKNSAYFFVVDVAEGTVQVGVIVKEQIDIRKQIKKFLEYIQLKIQDTLLEEILLLTLKSMLSTAERNGFIEDEDEILQYYGLEELIGRYGRRIRYDEEIIEICEKKKNYTDAKRYLIRDSLTEELDRIYQGTRRENVSGHPVHYMLLSDNDVIRDHALNVLLRSLYANRRLQNRRICIKRFAYWDDEQELQGLGTLYKSCFGGAMVIKFNMGCDDEDDQASGVREIIKSLCRKIKKYQHHVLSVICLPSSCLKHKELFTDNLGNISLVELSEKLASDESAKSFLRMRAREHGVHVDKYLYEEIEQGKGYSSVELDQIYERWQNQKLKTDVYPQYKSLRTLEYKAIKAKPQGEAYEEFMNMIGLSEAKRVLQQALDYYKVQKLLREKNLPAVSPTMHMVFTGNPGTAKTSVARLFARIMEKNKLLSKGTFIEVGRSDLVGRYVGWTAPTIKKKFKQASGGVLFIDEAYSLVDDRDGSYGDEAINTIVQEMENHRDDVVVIFAGYPDKMELFLQKNPGMRSRIAFHISFPDYSTTELCEIAKLLANKNGLEMQDGAKRKMKEIFEQAREQEDFGNGRFVRNLLEKARMAQASRLVQMNIDSLSRKDLITLCEEDIQTPDVPRQKETQIGFLRVG